MFASHLKHRLGDDFGKDRGNHQCGHAGHREQVLQDFAAPPVRQRADVGVVDGQDIEGKEPHRDVAQELRRRLPVLRPAPLQPFKRRPTSTIQSHNLPVKDHPAPSGRDRLSGRRRDLREGSGDDRRVPRKDSNSPGIQNDSPTLTSLNLSRLTALASGRVIPPRGML